MGVVVGSHIPGIDNDTSRLWHMSLGDTGEDAIKILIKQCLLKGAWN